MLDDALDISFDFEIINQMKSIEFL